LEYQCKTQRRADAAETPEEVPGNYETMAREKIHVVKHALLMSFPLGSLRKAGNTTVFSRILSVVMIAYMIHMETELRILSIL
jgi:hypothetical protein